MNVFDSVTKVYLAVLRIARVDVHDCGDLYASPHDLQSYNLWPQFLYVVAFQ